MLKLKYYLLIFAVIHAYAYELKAQFITPMGIGNYGAVHSYHINPSLNAYSNYSWHINLAGAWANVNNNYLTLKLPFSAYKYIGNNVPSVYKDENGNPVFDKNWLHENLNGRDKQVAVSSDVYGPSASVKIKSWRVGFVTSSHATGRISNLPENLAHAVFKELDSTQGAYNLFNSLAEGGLNTIDRFAVSGNSRVAAGLNVSKAIQLDWKRQLLLGVTVKRNWGFPGFYMDHAGIDARTVNADSLVIQPTSLKEVTYGDQTGKGWGVDIGATYLFNKRDNKRQGGYHKNQTRYWAKFGVAIMDIGKITYRDALFKEVYTTEAVGINVNSAYRNSVSGAYNYQALVDSFFYKFGSVNEYKGNYVVGLPTRLVLSADFQLKKNFFIGTVLTQSLRKKMSQHARYQSALMVAPRWEYRFFEISLPVLLEYDYRAARVGTSMRFGPFYIGTNNLASFVYTKSVRDVDVFAGIAFSELPDFNFGKFIRNWKSRNIKAYQTCFNAF